MAHRTGIAGALEMKTNIGLPNWNRAPSAGVPAVSRKGAQRFRSEKAYGLTNMYVPPEREFEGRVASVLNRIF